MRCGVREEMSPQCALRTRSVRHDHEGRLRSRTAFRGSSRGGRSWGPFHQFLAKDGRMRLETPDGCP
jgi:hypothetical protein